jgi:hypothetical protein
VSEIAADSLEEMIFQVIKEEKPQNVSHLIALLRDRLQISEEQALNKIMDLETRGRIKFADQPQPSPSNISTYLRTSQASWYWITIIFALLTLISVFLIPENLQPVSYLRNVVGAIFVLYLPGYTLIKTLFPVEMPIKTSEENFNRIERFVLSISMSLVVVPIVGLLLNYTPWGIGLVPMTFTIFAFSMLFSATAVIREHQAKMKTPIL